MYLPEFYLETTLLEDYERKVQEYLVRYAFKRKISINTKVLFSVSLSIFVRLKEYLRYLIRLIQRETISF